MMEIFWSFWLLTVLALGIEAVLTHVARRRGREAPWNVPVHFKPPQFADTRLNSIEAFLLVILMPLGILLVLAGIGTAIFLSSETVGFAIVLVGWACLLARGLFLAACLAFADKVGESKSLRSA